MGTPSYSESQAATSNVLSRLEIRVTLSHSPPLTRQYSLTVSWANTSIIYHLVKVVIILLINMNIVPHIFSQYIHSYKHQFEIYHELMS